MPEHDDAGLVTEEAAKGVSVWVLLIVMLHLPGDETVLERFANEKDCMKERDRIGEAMAGAYPYERDFLIVCQYRARGI